MAEPQILHADWL